jgi:hypothetical protein
MNANVEGEARKESEARWKNKKKTLSFLRPSIFFTSPLYFVENEKICKERNF